MLRKITIEGFKSVGQRTELRLAPLTVLTGTNSAGKSTVLQTLLLHAQTLQSSVHSGSVVLNGHIEQLGRFSDIATSNSGEHAICLGFDLDVDPNRHLLDDTILSRSWWSPLDMGASWDSGDMELASVHCEYSFSRGGKPTKKKQVLELEPLLLSTTLSAEFHTDRGLESVSVRANRSRSTVEARARGLDLDTEHLEPYRRELEYEVKEEASSERSQPHVFYSKSYLTYAKARGVRLVHFVPEGKFVTYGEGNRVAWSFLWDVMAGRYLSYRGAGNRHLKLEPGLDVAAGDIVAAVLLPLVDQMSRNRDIEKHSSASLSDLLKAFGGAPGVSLSEVGKLISALELDAQRALSENLHRQGLSFLNRVRRMPGHPVVGSVVPISERVSAAGSYVQHYFKDCIKYLGPLRDEPRAVYPISGSAINPRDVGIRGENAAAVLHNFGEVTVSNVHPSQLLASLDKPIISSSSLKNAVREWLGYLSIADEIDTNDRGTEGYEVLITPPGGHGSHGVSHVGVGVSQVLPVVVQSLLAESGTVLLFEQPELHLHPRVQSRLADFFYAMTVLGKQCIVETHSEYLVNRLRCLRALAPGDTLGSSVLLYFVSMTDAGSQFDEVAIDQYGRIGQWPKGFFDEADQLAYDIVEASLAKAEKGK